LMVRALPLGRRAHLRRRWLSMRRVACLRSMT
jgi:hypothetical protein